MSATNKEIVAKINAAFAEGNSEEFLSFCAEDAEWQMVGDKTFRGKQLLREFLKSMEESGMEPPSITVELMIAEEDAVVCYGNMTMKEKDAKAVPVSFCDVYQFRNGEIIKLQSFVVKHQWQGGEQKAAA